MLQAPRRRGALLTARRLLTGLLFGVMIGCADAEDEGRTGQGGGEDPPATTTRGVREGAPPTGLRKNPAQPKSDRPADRTP